MLVTALSPVIGYDKASAIAHKAVDENKTLREERLRLATLVQRNLTRLLFQRIWLEIHTRISRLLDPF